MDKNRIQVDVMNTMKHVERTYPIVKECIDARINLEKPRGAALVSLMILDIYRGIRKYMYCTGRVIERELSHLLNKRVYPPHYPSCLNVLSDTQEESNVCYISKSSIKKIHYTMSTIMNIDLTTKYSIRYLMISDHAFHQICSSRNEVMDIFLLLSEILVSTAYDDKYYNNSLLHCHTQKPLENALGYIPQSKKMTRSMKGHINFIQFTHIVPRRGTRKQLLVLGELSSDITPSIMITSLTLDPWIDDTIKPMLYSNFYKYVIVSITSKKDSGIIQEKMDYFFHLKPGKKEFFRIMDRLEEGYIVGTGMYRTDRVMKCGIEFVDRFSEEFNADNYVRKMSSTLDTQHFLEEFDGGALIKILESIPNFVYAFSEQQRSLISSHHNTVVVGRSGTGKTTCAVMRMIGIRLLEVASKNSKKGIKKIRYRDLCDSKS